MKKILFLLIFLINWVIIVKEADAQIPILYYDFENNSDRSGFENAVESAVNGGSGALTKAGGNGSALQIRSIDGAGIYNLGSFTGQAITTHQGGWSSQQTDPGIYADYYYQFTVNTTGFSGITISFDNQSDSDGPARTGVSWSVDGTNFVASSTSPNLTGNNTYLTGQFALQSGADNRGSMIIRIYAYNGSSNDRAGRDGFSSHGKFSIDNLTVFANSISTNAGTKDLISEANLYTCITSGSTGSIISRNGWSVTSGSTVVLSSDFSLKASETLTVLSGGTITFGANSLLGGASSGFILSSGAAINIGSPAGITSSGPAGNIQTSVRNFNAGAAFIYNGNSAQVTGSGLPQSVNNLTINNSEGVSLSSNTSVTSVLTLTSGVFAIGSRTLTIANAIQGTRSNLSTTALSNLIVSGAGNGIVIPSSASQLHNLTVSNFQAAGVLLEGNININNGTADISGFIKLNFTKLTATGNSTIKGSPTGKISLKGDLADQITGFTTNTYSSVDGGQYSFSGSSVQTIPGGTYTNLQAVNSAGINLSGTVIVTGILTLSDVLNIGPATLNISNPIAGTIGNLRSTGSSNLIISGFMPSIVIPSSLTELNNLNISNNQVVTAAGDLKINGVLTLEPSAAFLNMGQNTLTIGSDVTNPGELIRNGGSIRGKIKRWFAAGASLNKVFPFDNGFGAFSQAKISFSSLTTGGTLTAAFHNSGSGSLPNQGDGNYIPAPELHVNLVNLAPQYWTITAGDGLADANYNLELTGDGIPNVSNLNYIAVIKRHDSSSPWTWSNNNYAVSTGTTVNPVLYYNGGTSFSDFGVGGNIDNLLPVELESFTSVLNGNNITLNWSTSSEENNSGFDIERKAGDSQWIKIGDAQGHGNSNVTNAYSYSDRNLNSEKYNYRLKQIDFNGNYKYYELANEVVIGTPKKFTLLQNYPNPFNPSTTINFELPISNFVSLKVYDMMGKEVASLVNENKAAGFYSVKFDASKLSSGIYFYKIQAGDFSATKKLMLVK